MSVSDPFLKRPLLTLVVSMLIVLAGLVSLSGLEIENLPPIAPTRVSVSATYPGASAEVVEQGTLHGVHVRTRRPRLAGLRRTRRRRSSTSRKSS